MTNTADFEKMERDGWADPGIAKGYAGAFENATRLVPRILPAALMPAQGLMFLTFAPATAWWQRNWYRAAPR